MRHRLVELCSLGGFVLYLTMRFANSKEFDLFTAEDWLENKNGLMLSYLWMLLEVMLIIANP